MTLYLALLLPFFSALATALASGMHGGNHFSKWRIAAVHFIFLPTVAAFFWLFLRGSKQAKAELDLIDGKGDLLAVRRAYPLGLGYVMQRVIAHVMQNPWPELCDIRRQQELCGGFAIGFVLAMPTATAIALLS